MDTSAIPDHDAPEVLRPEESAELSAADNSENESDWTSSTLSVTAELLCGVRDGLLKSIARGLCIISENCKVWPPSYTFNAHCPQSFQQTEVDR